MVKHLGVLITRPLAQAQHLREIIQQAGYQTYLLPTLEIIPLEDNALLLEQIRSLATYDLAIFISANAVIYSYPYLKEIYPIWPKQITITAIGQATQQTLEKFNLPVTLRPTDFNTENLLALDELQAVTGKKIMLFRGIDGRKLLAHTLQDRGAILTEAICYQRKCPQHSISLLSKTIANPNIHITTITSGESLLNLLHMLDDRGKQWLQKLPMVVMSQRIADLAIQNGIKKVIVANQASDEAILEAILHYFQ